MIASLFDWFEMRGINPVRTTDFVAVGLVLGGFILGYLFASI